MTSKGDDCYFFYYSTCAKGDSCPFRHCEAAMGSEIMCGLWKENRCFRSVCKFRHMEIKKNRKEIPCYWENQPGGCQKPHCAFHHEKSRVIDGMYVPPDKGPVVQKEKEEETTQEDHALSVPVPISNPTNPQLRGVKKSETQESVPSPTHPPVVINPVDDEDDDDQISEEGDEVSSPRKLENSSKDDSLNFGIKTLEEIRLRKALKAGLKRVDLPSSNGAGTEKEVILSLTQPAALATKSGTGKRTVADRLGKRIDKEDMPVENDLRLKGDLAKRLGGFVDSPQDNPAMKPVRERLGTSPDLTAPKSPKSEPKSSGEIRIKTLEEIRKEKAAKSQLQCKGIRVVPEMSAKTPSSTQKGNGPQAKTFSEFLHEKKMMLEKKALSQQGNSSPESQEGHANAETVKAASQEEVRVKTLEEIRKEKAARMEGLAQGTSSNTPSSSEVKRRILRISKNSSTAPTVSHKKSEDSEKKMDQDSECAVASEKSTSPSQGVTVKTFEEIMREKRLRKQKEDQATLTSQERNGQKSAPGISEEKPPAIIGPRITGPAASKSDSSSQANLSVRQHLGLKSQTLVVPQTMSVELQAKEDSLSLKKLKRSAPAASPGHVLDVAASGLSQGLQDSQSGVIVESPKTSPGKATETKVRPKLNVKPSVMKPAGQVKLGQKKKSAGSHCSAVAAVKPLNAVPASEFEPPSKRIALSAPLCNVEGGANTQQMSSLTEEISLPSKTTASVTEPFSVPPSPVIKPPPQTRAHIQSVVSSHNRAGSSSTTDDFENLLDEFTDDKLEDEVELEPGKGEDDLLLELSEMIDI